MKVLPLTLLSVVLGLTSQAQEFPLPAADILPPDSKPELVQSGFKFTEGPTPAADGRIFFSDIPNNRTQIFDPTSGQVTVHRENSGGANGLIFDSKGSLLSCEGASKQVTIQKGDQYVPLTSEFEGKKYNSPNDLDLDAQGGIYFTDPSYGKPDNKTQDKEAVYYISSRDGKVTRVIDSLVRPNGITISKDNKTLYVADNGAKNVHAFDITGEGTVSNGRVLLPKTLGCDGITLDEKGNLYITTKFGVSIYSATGTALGVIPFPEVPANCKFGAKGSKTLYVTARTGFYKIKLAVDGK
jgi:sugar lactone lactonase YvrE